ncbi:hypothetical protein XU06_22845 [Rhodococcus erythropolis]|uniref:hypothetical protein n=1 Tax=Rhodococcus erythropolis TaxID=1833 RepID=UPI00061B68FC|nr:hypothetical protein [Rhodococcus erythropolis]AKD99198.1 hypothetical protein XU06_22845 [Rhodococcus erythropolis]
MSNAHHFKFSTNWRGQDRLCGQCGNTYGEGRHIEITILEPFTSYVCPSGKGLGHSGIYTGAYNPALRTMRDHLCDCGLRLVEEDTELWKLSWEMQDDDTPWRRIDRVGSRHSTQQQRDGLETLASNGESIRNVRLVRLVEEVAQ